MNIDEKLQLLETEINDRIEDQMKKRSHDKRMAFLLKMASIFFAAMVTILLGIEGAGEYGTWLKNLALILGASITVITAYDAFFDYRSLWIRRTVLMARLFGLRRELRFYCAGAESGEIDIEKITRFKNRFNRILQDDLREWLKLRSEGENQTDDTGPSTPASPDSN